MQVWYVHSYPSLSNRKHLSMCTAYYAALAALRGEFESLEYNQQGFVTCCKPSESN